MQDNTSWTPYPDDNLLNLTNQNSINEEEAKGIALAELYVFELDVNLPISSTLILAIHRTAFGHLYHWAGKWRTVQVIVGLLEPPLPFQIVPLIYQFTDNLNFKMSQSASKQDVIDCLFYAHYEFVRIHPFNNGNGRTGRILMNLVAMKLGYQPLILYHHAGESRRIYIDAMKAADKGNTEPLYLLISSELRAF